MLERSDWTIQQWRAYAVRLLGRREYSRVELMRKLTHLGATQEMAQTIVQQLIEASWQSDERYTDMLVRAKSTRYGNARLRQSLKQNGVPEDVWTGRLPDEGTEAANALAVLQKKMRTRPQTAQEKARAWRFMQYRGFSMEHFQAALNTWRAQDDTESLGDT